ncbi:MAG: Calx-beta domain-containing protein, partial [Roseiflexaceae bacterium]
MLPQRLYRNFSRLVLLALLCGWLPSAAVAQPGAVGATMSAASDRVPTAIQQSVPTFVDPHLPSLTLQLEIAPSPIAVGDTAILTVTVTNQAPDAANELVVTMPTPGAALAEVGPNTLSPTQGWAWRLPRLDAHSSTTLAGSARLVRMPPGEALLFLASATARGLSRPVQERGGAIVADRARGPATATFTPGSRTTLRGADGRITVTIPGQAANRRLTVRQTPGTGPNGVSSIVTFKRGFAPFTLEVADDQGRAVQQFTQPLSITVAYTPEQLQALGIAEDDLSLFQFDAQQRRWTAVGTNIDSQAHTATAIVSQLTASSSGFELSDGSSPSDAYIPSLQGWQVSMYTGAATYSYPIDVPAGPNDSKPQLELSYNSTATDGTGGKRVKQQSGWAGKGWSLDTGSIALNKIVDGNYTARYYTMVLNGQSFDLMRGDPLAGNAGSSDQDPTHWTWSPTNESFIRVRAVSIGPSIASTLTAGTFGDHAGSNLNDGYGRGGMLSSVPQTRYKWQVWTKDGTLFEFEEDLWWGIEVCDTLTLEIETYKWLLSRVIDTHQNKVTYNYDRNSYVAVPVPDGVCQHRTMQGTVDRDAWPSNITWGANSSTGAPDRYKVVFISTVRTQDDQFESNNAQYGNANGAARETRQLQSIQVLSNSAGTWDLMRQYTLAIDAGLYSDQRLCPSTCTPDTAYPKLRLTGITHTGKSGIPLPPISFAYSQFGVDNLAVDATGGTSEFPNGGWNRLTQVTNGQSGQLNFEYANIGTALAQQSPVPPLAQQKLFMNNHRVIKKKARNGLGQDYLWQYTYGSPNYNTLGSTRGAEAPSKWHDGSYGTQLVPNSAALYYNAFYDWYHDAQAKLAHRRLKEFRGHDNVTEIDPTNAKTIHYFHQGQSVDSAGAPTNCIPHSGGRDPNIPNELCFQQLRDGEFLKGREYRTQFFDTNGATLLREVNHRFTVEFKSYGDPFSGLWRAFSYESQTDDTTYDSGNGAGLTKTTKYVYQNTLTDPTLGLMTFQSAQYGNLYRTEEYAAGVLIRITDHNFGTVDIPGSYIVDREWATSVRDSQRRLLAHSQYFYDGNNTSPSIIGAKGELSRVGKYFTVPLQTSAQGITLQGQDITYTYDTYGNRLSETTYAQPGTRLYSGGSSWTISPPGNGSAARTVTTAYDNPATPIDEANSSLPIKITQPPATVGATPMVEQATYDYSMATLTSITDANNNATSAEYDQFGRLVKLIRPGDSTTFPTVQATYYDNGAQYEPFFRYKVERRETANQVGVRVSQQFYDGLGRKIQVKTESSDGTASLINQVVNTVYDGLDRATRTSQPRYVPESGGAFEARTPLAADWIERWTTTTYDGLGRPLLITAPDHTMANPDQTEHHYGITGSTTYDDVIDPNRHRAQQRYDVFGRLAEAVEFAGDCTSGLFFTNYTCTGTHTTPWTLYARTIYTYSPIDLLTNVTDAKGNVTSMQYDSLGRKSNLLNPALPAMRDPDMGDWNYSYDVNGNLTSQVDARGQQICFFYDALNRLLGKHAQPNGVCPGALAGSDVVYNYDELASTNGKGQRTSISNPNATTRWNFDTRGRKSSEVYSNVAGLAAGQTRTFQWAYDSADRVTSISYPSTDQVNYTYDAGWHQTSACSALSCYVGNASNTDPATYTALDQPLRWAFGNDAIQQWTYSDPMQRLQRTQVGTAATPTSLMHRSYTYDTSGNVKTIGDTVASQTQNFDYDAQDRLTHFSTSVGATFALSPAAPHADLPVALNARAVGSPSAQAARLTLEQAAFNPNQAAALDASDTGDAPAMGERVTALASAAAVAQPNAVVSAAPPRPDFSRLPLAFVPNRGMVDARARFLVHGGTGTLFFTPEEVVLALPDASAAISTTVARVRYEGANPHPRLAAGNQLPGVANFFVGNDPARWQADLPTYTGISYAALYNGIDLHYDGSEGKLKSTYIVAPGADPAQIRWRYVGAADLRVDSAGGDLIVRMPSPSASRNGRTLIEQAPVAWQDINGRRVAISARYAVDSNGRVSFVLGNYDPTQPLLIDPILTYSSYLGGAGGDDGQGIAVDASGNIFVAGSTRSSNFPTSASTFQSSRNGAQDAFVTKLNPSGSTVLYSTYLGGSLEDEAHAIAIDSSGMIYLTGETRSTNFPMKNALDSTFGGGTCGSNPCNDVFVTKLDPALSGSSQLKYSTYVGGNGEDIGFGVAADSSGNAFVTGLIAGGLPIPSKTFDSSYGGANDAFVIKLKTTVTSSGTGSNLYATYLGGTGDDQGNGIAIDSSGNVYVAGETASSGGSSTGYPTKNPYQPSNGGSDDVFVTKLNPNTTGTSSLLYSTYLGGNADDDGNAIALDSSGNAYVTGFADSSNWPTVTPWQSSKAGLKDVFLAKVNTAASGVPSLTYSTYIGGTNEDRGLAIARDSAGLIYLTGLTRSSDYPLENPVQASFGGGTCGTVSCTDSFVTAFSLAANSPIYSTYLGGSNDEFGNAITADSSAAYVAGTTWSNNFPTANPRQATFGGGTLDAFVAKLTLPKVQLSAATASASENAGTLNVTVNLSAASAYTVTVGYATSNGTATAGSDYAASAGTLVFAPNQTSQTISIPIVNDASDEPNETFTIALNNPSNAGLGTPTSATLTIIDDDAPPTVSWQAANFSVGEAAGSGLATVLLSAPSAFNVTVAYATSNGTATAGSDYTATSGTLTFVPGENSQSLSLTMLNDTLQESSETINLTLSSPANATIGAPNPATMTIIDDETPPIPNEEFYTYDQIGNLLSKTSVGNYGYGASGVGTGAGPHQARTVGTTTYSYDLNGNLTGGGGSNYTWDAENRPLTISHTSGSESYAYDADGERVKVVAGSTTTVYLGGLWEETSAGATKAYYSFGGQTVAIRDSVQGLSFLHSDHLGSVSVVSGANASLLSSQRFDPWGKVLPGGTVTQTQKNYTGQYLDTTGLLYYHARYYDPNLARFVSADSVVPGNASGGMDGVAIKPLTVDFHEPGFAGGVASENNQPFWFQMSDKDRQKAGRPWGPVNPQALNRYSYVQNNPLRYMDPSGHTAYLSKSEAQELSKALRRTAAELGFIGGGLLVPVRDLLQRIWAASGLTEAALSGG